MLVQTLHNMDNSQPTFSRKKTITGLALAGFASGLLAIIAIEVLSRFPRLEEFLAAPAAVYTPGLVFGLMFSSYCAIFLRARAWIKLLSLIAASTVAYYSAVKTTIYLVVSLTKLSAEWIRRGWLFDVALFVGGIVGAFLLLAAVQLLLSRSRSRKTPLATALLWSLAGGALAIVGWQLGGSVGKLLWLTLHAVGLTGFDATVEDAIRNETVNFHSLYPVWQMGMGPVLGLLIRKGSAAQPERQSATSA
jgi:hypothetical protein